MDKEPLIDIGEIDTTKIEDFGIYAFNRIIDGDIFVVHQDGAHPSIIWQFAKLDFQKIDTEKLKETFLEIANASATAINASNDAKPNEKIEETKNKLRTLKKGEKHFDEYIENPNFAQALIDGQVSEGDMLSASIFELNQYMQNDGDRFIRPNKQGIDNDARNDFQERVFPAIQNLLVDQVTDISELD